MFDVFADAESLTYDGKIELGGIVWCDGRCRVGFTVEIPRINFHVTNLENSMQKRNLKEQGS